MRIKTLIFWVRPGLWMGWVYTGLFWFANLLSLSRWMSKQKAAGEGMNDFFVWKRDYGRRYRLYEYVFDRQGLAGAPFDYVEFGVSAGHSIKWWADRVEHPESRFYGFDTFDGLPENWGTYRKGDMDSRMPQTDDPRVRFIKGLFQDTLPSFLKDGVLTARRKVIHLDADLFSSTLYALTAMAPYLNTGDILLFDEFSVPNHEFLAFKMFTRSYYIKTALLGAVNNYLQTAFILER